MGSIALLPALPSLGCFLALRTYPDKFEVAPDYLVVAHRTNVIFNGGKRFHGYIFDAAAPHTANMIVVSYVGIEPLLGASKLQFLYHATIRENL